MPRFKLTIEYDGSSYSGWQRQANARSIQQALEEAVLRFDPGAYTTAPFVHDHWEEVYLVSGDLTVGNDAQGEGGENFLAPTYACRPPGVSHGPFKSETGCLLYEIHYYDEAKG